SAVREALKAGDMDRAAAILGRPFAIQGEVIHGDKRGRTIGVPTANVAMGDYMRPAYGVYATRTRLPDGRAINGVANLGVRPMFEIEQPLLEVWLLDFNESLYGHVLETELIAFLRGEMKFDGLDALKVQSEADAEAARVALALRVPLPAGEGRPAPLSARRLFGDGHQVVVQRLALVVDDDGDAPHRDFLQQLERLAAILAVVDEDDFGGRGLRALGRHLHG